LGLRRYFVAIVAQVLMLMSIGFERVSGCTWQEKIADCSDFLEA
jgi:hypothetical protein